MYNCKVLHFVNNEIKSHWEFGDELDKAIDFIHNYCEQVLEVGKHNFYVVDIERNFTVFYRHEFEIIE